MEKCVDYWCEHFGKGSSNCGKCEKKEVYKDRPDIRTLLQRRAYKQMELDRGNDSKKSMAQDR